MKHFCQWPLQRVEVLLDEIKRQPNGTAASLASAVSARVGYMVTKNMVIGFLDRRGISLPRSGKAKSPRPSRLRRKILPTPWTSQQTELMKECASMKVNIDDIADILGKPTEEVAERAKSVGAIVVAAPPLEPLQALPDPVLETDVGEEVYRLTPFTCHWPIGDPKQPGFRFCHDAAPGDGPYCAAHSAIARGNCNLRGLWRVSG